jgi:hypothetical protein
MKFRLLRAEEIECRVKVVKENGFSLLLYKDARCDMNILDETVGCLNWQRSHLRDNKNCVVSIWDSDKKQWISKEDTGSESNTEAIKGLASDSFKRACFNWGIGRELYTAPFIWINNPRYIRNGKKVYERFHVQSVVYDERRIKSITIADSKGVVVYGRGSGTSSARGKKYVQPLTQQVQQGAVGPKQPDVPALISYAKSKFMSVDQAIQAAQNRYPGITEKTINKIKQEMA